MVVLYITENWEQILTKNPPFFTIFWRELNAFLTESELTQVNKSARLDEDADNCSQISYGMQTQDAPMLDDLAPLIHHTEASTIDSLIPSSQSDHSSKGMNWVYAMIQKP